MPSPQPKSCFLLHFQPTKVLKKNQQEVIYTIHVEISEPIDSANFPCYMITNMPEKKYHSFPMPDFSAELITFILSDFTVIKEYEDDPDGSLYCGYLKYKEADANNKNYDISIDYSNRFSCISFGYDSKRIKETDIFRKIKEFCDMRDVEVIFH